MREMHDTEIEFFKDTLESRKVQIEKNISGVEKEMDEFGIIAVMSVGARRDFLIKNNRTKEVIKTTLGNCSLAVMNPICQKEWKHSISKNVLLKDPRFSLTFRRFI